MADNVIHPEHYCSSPARCTCGRRIECIDVVEHMPFNVGAAVKYLWRHELKGKPLEDLRKAAWYIAREIERRERAEMATEQDSPIYDAMSGRR